MNKRRQQGLTLIELVLFMVVISVGVVGILSVMNLTVKNSADPLVRKQAAALADSILEEILQKEYEDPDGLPNAVESGRDTYDDVDDYNGLGIAAFTDLPAALSSAYTVAISVTTTTLGTLSVKKITVTAARGAENVSMSGYRAKY